MAGTIIDIYTHIFPERFFREMTKVTPMMENLGPRLRSITKLFDLDARFKEMDTFGDYRQIISLPNPPIEDFAAIPKGSSSKAIDAMVVEHGPAPALLRYKFWRLVKTIHDEVAAAANVRVLPVPPETVQSNGFRRPEYYSTDWIHANEQYGELVLKQIDTSRAQI